MISEMLKYLRHSRGLTQKEASEQIGIALATYSNYESGHRSPKVETIIALADFYEVSTDCLLRETPPPENSFAARLKMCIEISGKSQPQIAEELKIPLRVLAGHAAKTEPTLSFLSAYAKYFGVSVDYLVSGSKEKELIPEGFENG